MPKFHVKLKALTGILFCAMYHFCTNSCFTVRAQLCGTQSVRPPFRRHVTTAWISYGVLWKLLTQCSFANDKTFSKTLAAFLKGRVPVKNHSRKLRWMKLDRPLFRVQSYQQDKLSGNEAWHRPTVHKRDAKLLKRNKCQLLQHVKSPRQGSQGCIFLQRSFKSWW